MASAGTVTVDFAAETARFTAELKKVNSQLKGMESGFSSLAKAARIATGVFASIGLGNFVKQAASAADELGKTADKINISTERLKAFQVAAQDAGVSLQGANKILLESQKRLGEAAAGTGEAAKYIGLLGLNINELQALSPEQLFATYSDAINGLANRSEQLAAANALMGKSAQEAFNLIQAGSPAINEAADFVERFGLALTRVEIKQIEAAGDALGRIQTVAESAGQRVALGLSPAIEFFSNVLLDATGNTRGLQGVVEQFSAVAITAFELVANVVRSLVAAFDALAGGAQNTLASIIEIGIKAKVLLESPNAFFTPAVQEELAKGIENATGALRASAQQNFLEAEESLRRVKSISDIQAQIVAVMESSRARAEAAVAAQQAGATGGTNLFGEQIGLTPEQNLATQIEIANQAAQAQIAAEQQVTSAVQAELDKRSQSYQSNYEALHRLSLNATQQEISLRQQATATALNGIAALATRSKTWAKIQKAIQIGQAIRDTYVGITHQLTSGDPYTAVARAAVVGAFGFAQVAAIKATPEYGGGGSPSFGGGPSLGSPSNSVFAPASGEQQFGATSQNAVQVIINGNLYNTDQTRQVLIDALKEAADADVVIFGPASRQAQEIRGD